MIWTANRKHGAFTFACGVLLIAGCGDGSDVDLNDIAGNVTFAGKPVVFGQIEFVPDAKNGHPGGPPGRAGIIAGRYNTLEGGRGIVKGPHHVRITAYDQQPPPIPEVVDETVPFEGPKPLFTGYTIEADITGETQDFDVPESAKGSGTSQAPARRPRNDP